MKQVKEAGINQCLPVVVSWSVGLLCVGVLVALCEKRDDFSTDYVPALFYGASVSSLSSKESGSDPSIVRAEPGMR